MNNFLKPSFMRNIILVSSNRNATKLGANIRYLCDKTQKSSAVEDKRLDSLIPKMSGFAKAYQKQETAVADEQKSAEEPVQSFAAMLRNSKFIDVKFSTFISKTLFMTL